MSDSSCARQRARSSTFIFSESLCVVRWMKGVLDSTAGFFVLHFFARGNGARKDGKEGVKALKTYYYEALRRPVHCSESFQEARLTLLTYAYVCLRMLTYADRHLDWYRLARPSKLDAFVIQVHLLQIVGCGKIPSSPLSQKTPASPSPRYRRFFCFVVRR